VRPSYAISMSVGMWC